MRTLKKNDRGMLRRIFAFKVSCAYLRLMSNLEIREEEGDYLIDQ